MSEGLYRVFSAIGGFFFKKIFPGAKTQISDHGLISDLGEEKKIFFYEIFSLGLNYGSRFCSVVYNLVIIVIIF